MEILQGLSHSCVKFYLHVRIHRPVSKNSAKLKKKNSSSSREKTMHTVSISARSVSRALYLLSLLF